MPEKKKAGWLMKFAGAGGWSGSRAHQNKAAGSGLGQPKQVVRSGLLNNKEPRSGWDTFLQN